MNEEAVGGVHWSFWIVGAVALIRNVLGVMNYLGQTNADALVNYPEAARLAAFCFY